MHHKQASRSVKWVSWQFLHDSIVQRDAILNSSDSTFEPPNVRWINTRKLPGWMRLTQGTYLIAPPAPQPQEYEHGRSSKKLE